MTSAPMEPTLNRTALFPVHLGLGGRMVEFGGWEMPVQYPSGVLAEHDAVRSRAGVFDVSHMGRISVTGDDAAVYLDTLITSNIGRLRSGRARYGLICNENGGIMDDVVTLRRFESSFLVICNAASWDRVIGWMRQLQAGFGTVTVAPRRDETAMIALQGPHAPTALAPLADPTVVNLARFGCAETRIAGVAALVSRTGYTGEDGFEIILDAGDAPHVWNLLVTERGAFPCGLAARDLLRLEAGLLLYGQDMDTNVTPLEAGLDRFVDLEKEPAFTGAHALREQAARGPDRRLTGFTVAGRSAPRHGYRVRTPDGAESVVTSGTYSPELGHSIGLAYLPSAWTTPGSVLDVDIRGRSVTGTVVTLPFRS